MKMAEALLLRSDYVQKLNSLQNRILTNLKVQENEKPSEQPEELLKEASLINEQICSLVQKINRTNSNAHLPDGRTIMEALTERDMLRRMRGLLSSMASAAREKDYRLTHSEVRMTLTMDISQIQKQIDALSKQYRELDTMIQKANWLTDLEE